jgi:carbon storage regulator CsrA
MLVLSRGEGDSVSVPEVGLAIRVLRIQGSRIRLGIDAPDDVRVVRTELLEQACQRREANGDVHDMRERLDRARASLELAERFWQRGERDLAEAALRRMESAGEIDAGQVAEEPAGYSIAAPHAVQPFRVAA